MKVLWLINITLPRIANKIGVQSTHVGGGWLTGISNQLLLSKKVELIVCSPGKSANNAGLTQIEDNLYCVFFNERNPKKYDSNLASVFEGILDDVKPDIVHIFGTEYPRTFSMIEATNRRDIPHVVSITGMVNPYTKKYYGSVPSEYRGNLFRGMIARLLGIPTLKDGKRDFSSRSVYEKKALKNCSEVIGRTTWDYTCTKLINKDINYNYCNETLRDSFYQYRWDYNNCTPHTIVIPQIGYPLKGFEVFLEGLELVKERYPDVKVFIPGWNRFCMSDGIKKRMTIYFSEYDHYLKRIIDKKNLMDCLVFCGPLDEDAMCKTMLKSNVFVLPSALENSPNSMGEAMLLGVPTVASAVGGVQDLLLDKEEGFLFPYDEPYMMAHYVMELFEDNDLRCKISNKGRKRAQSLYSQEVNYETLCKIYNNIVTERRKAK